MSACVDFGEGLDEGNEWPSARKTFGLYLMGEKME